MIRFKKMRLFTAAVAAVASPLAAQAGTRSSVAYVADFEYDEAYLVEWDTARLAAHVTGGLGQSDGRYTDDGTQRLVTLATPLTFTQDIVDGCGLAASTTHEIDQVVFRTTGGSPTQGRAQLVEIGTDTVVGGCAPGTTPFGAPGDPGLDAARVDMNDRASMADLVPGAQLAGMTETPVPPTGPEQSNVAQVVSFGRDGVTFQSTGDVVPANTKRGWIVLDFGSSAYGYTRLTRNAVTGVEAWLGAPWVGGLPASVHNVLMVRPNAAAGFGTTAQAARSWQAGLFRSFDPQIFWDLNADGTGALDQRALADGSLVFTMPLTWTLVGANLQLERSFDFSVNYRQRLWVPLANYGKSHFVIESEDFYDADGTFISHLTLPRVQFEIDRGPPVPPTD